MFEIKEVSSVEATGRLFWAGTLAGGSLIGSVWLLGAALAC